MSFRLVSNSFLYFPKNNNIYTLVFGLFFVNMLVVAKPPSSFITVPVQNKLSRPNSSKFGVILLTEVAEFTFLLFFSILANRKFNHG